MNIKIINETEPVLNMIWMEKLLQSSDFINGSLVERERINRLDQQGLKQGVWKTFYDNGRIKTEANYKNDILNGPYKEYDENGLVKVYFQYAEGKMLEKADTAELDIEVRNKYDEEGKDNLYRDIIEKIYR